MSAPKPETAVLAALIQPALFGQGGNQISLVTITATITITITTALAALGWKERDDRTRAAAVQDPPRGLERDVFLFIF